MKKFTRNIIRKQLKKGIILTVHGNNLYDVTVPGRPYPFLRVVCINKLEFQVNDSVLIGFFENDPQKPFLLGFANSQGNLGLKEVMLNLVPMVFYYGNWGGTNHVPGTMVGICPSGTGTLVKELEDDRAGLLTVRVPERIEHGYMAGADHWYNTDSGEFNTIRLVTFDVPYSSSLITECIGYFSGPELRCLYENVGIGRMEYRKNNYNQDESTDVPAAQDLRPSEGNCQEDNYRTAYIADRFTKAEKESWWF